MGFDGSEDGRIIGLIRHLLVTIKYLIKIMKILMMHLLNPFLQILYLIKYFSYLKSYSDSSYLNTFFEKNLENLKELSSDLQKSSKTMHTALTF